MPRGMIAFLDRPWGVALALLGAFVLPLLLADLLGGGDPPRSVALVTTIDAERSGVPEAQQTAAIPDLRPTRALPRLAPAADGVAAPAAAAPAPAAPRSGRGARRARRDDRQPGARAYGEHMLRYLKMQGGGQTAATHLGAGGRRRGLRRGWRGEAGRGAAP